MYQQLIERYLHWVTSKPLHILANSSVTSSPIRTNGALYLTSLNFSVSLVHFMAGLRASLALFPLTTSS